MREAGSQNPTEHTGRKQCVHGNAYDINWAFKGKFDQMQLLRDRNEGPEITNSISAQHGTLRRGPV